MRIFILAVLFLLFFGACSKDDSLNFKDAVYGEYWGMQSASFWNILGDSDSYTENKTFTISAHSSDSMWINEVRVFVDPSLTWSPYPHTTQYRFYDYIIKKDSLFVNFYSGGNGSGWWYHFKGKKVE